MSKDLYLKILSIILMIIAGVLLFIQVFKISGFQIDQTTVLLLAVLIVCGLIPFISKFKIGTVEADLTKDAKEVIEKSEKMPLSEPKERALGDSALYLNLINEDPSLALAKLRIDLETSIKKIRDKHPNEIRVFSSRRGLIGMVDELYNNNILNQKQYSLIQDILPLANRAIHGETIREREARELILLGQKLLIELNILQ